MRDYYPVTDECACWNCKVVLKPGDYAHHQYDDRVLCNDCMRECVAHNDYIESVSQDYQPV